MWFVTTILEARMSMLDSLVSIKAERGRVDSQHNHRENTLHRVNEPVNLAGNTGRTLSICLKGVRDRSRDSDQSKHCQADLGAPHEVFEQSRS